MKKKHLILKILLGIIASFFTLSTLWVVILKWHNVRYTTHMVSRMIENRNNPNYKIQKEWVEVKDISPILRKAIISGEDEWFCTHDGVDWNSIKNNIEAHFEKGKKLKGGSTISQQTAKNVFLWHGRSYTRKILELWYTFLIEKIWGKERIFEVYINIVEMGDGIFGMQKASEIYFHKDASKISRYEACLLVASLPSPLKRNPAKPTETQSRIASKIYYRLDNIYYPSWVTAK